MAWNRATVFWLVSLGLVASHVVHANVGIGSSWAGSSLRLRPAQFISKLKNVDYAWKVEESATIRLRGGSANEVAEAAKDPGEAMVESAVENLRNR
jgi:hypothetical protein